MNLDPRHLRIAGLVLLVAVIVAGAIIVLGDGGGSDEQRAEQTVLEFAAALQEENFEAACERFTEEAEAQIGGERSCPEALSEQVGDAAEDITVQVTDVRISGNRAVVETQSTSGDGGEPRESSVELVEVDDAWRIANLGE